MRHRLGFDPTGRNGLFPPASYDDLGKGKAGERAMQETKAVCGAAP
jgi:hypothetical protein